MPLFWGLGSASATIFSIISLAKAGSLKDIDHVVLFMQGMLTFLCVEGLELVC
jgi:phospholipase C